MEKDSNRLCRCPCINIQCYFCCVWSKTARYAVLKQSNVPTDLCFSNFPEKAVSLIESWQRKDQLSLFRSDLLEDGSFDEAVRGCDGVFHVAASMEFEIPSQENVGNVVYNHI